MIDEVELESSGSVKYQIQQGDESGTNKANDQNFLTKKLLNSYGGPRQHSPPRGGLRDFLLYA